MPDESPTSPSPSSPTVPASATPPAAVPVPPSAPTGTWRDTLADGIKGEKTLEQFKDVSSLAQDYLALKRWQSTAIKQPGPDAKPEEVAAYREKLGVPKDESGYGDLRLEPVTDGPPVNSALINEFFKPRALKSALTPTQAQDMLNAFRDYTAAQIGATKAKYVERQEQELEQKWGLNFDNNVAIAERGLLKAVQESGAGQETIDLLNNSLISMHPGFIKLAYWIGDKFAESGIIDGVSKGPLEPDAIKTRINEVRKELAAENGNDNKRSRQLQVELNRLYQTLHPS